MDGWKRLRAAGSQNTVVGQGVAFNALPPPPLRYFFFFNLGKEVVGSKAERLLSQDEGLEASWVRESLLHESLQSG